jgi:hypothetical protein
MYVTALAPITPDKSLSQIHLMIREEEGQQRPQQWCRYRQLLRDSC